MLDHLLLEYGRLHRDFRYEFYETQSFEILDLLESGVVDLGIVRTPCHISRQMEVRYFPSEPMVAVFDPVRFPQLQGEGPLELEKLEHLPLCIIRRYEDIFRKSCGDRGVTPHIACSSFQMSVSLVWAQNALGVGLIPLSALGCVEDTRLCHRTLGDPQLETRRVLLYMKKTELPEPAAGFLEFCKAQHAIEEKAPLS